MLIEAQGLYGHLSQPVLTAIGQALRVPLAEVHGVVRFYTLLYDRPTGRTIVRICTSPRCAQAGGEQVLRQVCRQLGVRPGEPTADGKFEVVPGSSHGVGQDSPDSVVRAVELFLSGSAR